MRALLRAVGVLIMAAIIAALAIFAAQNIRRVPLAYLGMTFTGNIWWICVGSAVLGFLLAFLAFAPGWAASGWRGRSLSRERALLEDELAAERAQHAQTRAEHEHLLAEHRQLLSQRGDLRRQPVGATAGATASTPANTPVAGPVSPAAPTAGGAEPVVTERQATLGERLHDAFTRRQEGVNAPDGTWNPNQPPAPTA